ncbi:MAG TPA: class I SAM-dependent methyltransferase [Usitatibacter sp.]|nr:class I SAM-dependent methyltransferase [Usitatibacter sp.]
MLTLPKPGPAGFSLDAPMLERILQHAKPLGHHEDPGTLNIGFGFLYYGLVRTLRPKHVVVIGSGFGFSVVCLALGLADNGAGALSFVDPSYSLLRHGPLHTVGGTSQWDEPGKVRAHFDRFGVAERVRHLRLTSAEFFKSYENLGLPDIDVAFIDGNHSYEDVRHDFLAALGRMKKGGYMLLHDTNIYVRELVRHAGVKRWLKEIQHETEWFEAIDFPFSSGVAMIRVLRDGPWHPAN